MCSLGAIMSIGDAYRKMGGALQQALKAAGPTGLHQGSPTIRDLPLVIKALGFEDRSVAEEAHLVLVALCGQDLGREPGPWQEWWSERGQEMIRHEAESKAAKELFLKFARDVLTGQWERAAASLSIDAAETVSRAEAGPLAAQLRESATALRRVYRDAKVSDVRLALPDQATLSVEWGELGFTFAEVLLVREEDGWKFAQAPWDPDTLT